MNEALRTDAKQSKDNTYFDIALNPEMKDALLSDKGVEEARKQ